MRPATAHKVIVFMHLTLGLLLAYAVPAFNRVYESTHPHWNDSDSVLIRAFHWPSYVWPVAGCAMAAIIYLLGLGKSDSALKKINIVALLVYALLAWHAIDWLLGFMFCHEWGCTRVLPTWKMLQ